MKVMTTSLGQSTVTHTHTHTLVYLGEAEVSRACGGGGVCVRAGVVGG